MKTFFKIILFIFLLILLNACDIAEKEITVKVPDEEVIAEGVTQAEIEEAFQTKYPEWNLEELEIKVTESRPEFAQGYVGPIGGGPGGYFFAAESNGTWIIAADGNGVLNCADIAPYNFPTDMIPECYDMEKQEIITR